MVAKKETIDGVIDLDEIMDMEEYYEQCGEDFCKSMKLHLGGLIILSIICLILIGILI